MDGWYRFWFEYGTDKYFLFEQVSWSNQVCCRIFLIYFSKISHVKLQWFHLFVVIVDCTQARNAITDGCWCSQEGFKIVSYHIQGNATPIHNPHNRTNTNQQTKIPHFQENDQTQLNHASDMIKSAPNSTNNRSNNNLSNINLANANSNSSSNESTDLVNNNNAEKIGGDTSHNQTSMLANRFEPVLM